MNELMQKLFEEYSTVLNDLNIGYPLKEETISHMWELIHAIDCLTFGDLTGEEIHKIILRYE